MGEFGLIARVVARLPQGGTSLLGPGDDAAVVSAPDARVVATTDLLVEGRHFRREWSDPVAIGRRAAAQNLADVAAMGAVPTALLVGLAAPADLDVAWAEGFADGLAAECGPLGASVVGGDVVASPVLTLAITALGDLQGRPPVTRSGASPGDVVFVAGRLGWSSAGLAQLEADPAAAGPHVEAYRCPSPPYALGPELARRGATAMVDTSDGLVADLQHIAVASGVRIELDTHRMAGRLSEGISMEQVLTGGEDHALAGTIPADVPLPGRVTVIGVVTPGDGAVLVDGAVLERGGFDHFADTTR